MSRLTQLQRKAALLRYYFEKEGRYPANVKSTIRDLAITRATLENWIKGSVSEPLKLASADQSLKTLLDVPSGPPGLLDEEFGVMELGKLLGLSRRECQFAIDQVAGELGPTFASFSMQPRSARHLLGLFQGLYVIYRLEQTAESFRATGREESVMCMALSVRYGLTGGKALSRDETRVRCKLNIPAYRLPVPMHEYDGYVTDADSAGRHYWMFEVRAEVQRDVVFMMTESLRRGPLHAPRRRLALGVMLSRTQDDPSQPAIWPIVLERHSDLGPITMKDADFEDSAEKRFVREQARLEDPKKVGRWVFPALKEAEEFAAFYRSQHP